MNIALACSLGNLYRQEGFPLLLVSLLMVRNLNFDLFCPSVLSLPFIDFVIVSFRGRPFNSWGEGMVFLSDQTFFLLPTKN